MVKLLARCTLSKRLYVPACLNEGRYEFTARRRRCDRDKLAITQPTEARAAKVSATSIGVAESNDGDDLTSERLLLWTLALHAKGNFVRGRAL